MQFDRVPTAEMRARLAAAGYHPLLYVPINALLVRVDAQVQTLAVLPELRWLGAFPAAYKLPPGLDSASNGQMSSDRWIQGSPAERQTEKYFASG